MSFQPQIPMSGIAGWRFLQRTQETQQATFEKSGVLARDIEYFQENIGKVETTADLVSDRRLLTVALGAFGLGDDIDKKAFIRKVLDEGTDDEKSFANRMTAQAYKDFAETFGFGNATGARTGDEGFAEKILDAYRVRAFEAAVGDADNNMRLAMNMNRELPDLAAEEGRTWYSVLASEPLSQVFQTAFGLPKDFYNIDVDRQVTILAQKSKQYFGSGEISVYSDPEVLEKLTTRFLAMAQIADGVSNATGPAASALILLQSRTSNGSSGLLNLLYDF